jgi:hypothetical protein
MAVAAPNNGAVPIQTLNGSTNDISPLLYFRWYEPIYYKLDDSDFPSDSRGKRGWWVGVTENVSHAMTFKILMDDTRKIVFCSNIRSALDPNCWNLHMDPLNKDPVLKPIIKSPSDTDDLHYGESSGATLMTIVDPNDLVGCTFLMPPQEDGQRFHARIVHAIIEQAQGLAKEPEQIKFRINLKKSYLTMTSSAI